METHEYAHEQHAFRMAMHAQDEHQAATHRSYAPQYPAGGAWQNCTSSPNPHKKQPLRHHCTHISVPHEDDERADAAFESRKLIVPALHHEHHPHHAVPHEDEEAEQWRQKYIATHNANVVLERKLQRILHTKHIARNFSHSIVI